MVHLVAHRPRMKPTGTNTFSQLEFELKAVCLNESLSFLRHVRTAGWLRFLANLELSDSPKDFSCLSFASIQNILDTEGPLVFN